MEELKPSSIYFSQDTIKNMFGDNTRHAGVQIGQTLDNLCEGRISVYDIATISVVNIDGKWFTADNRRLWVFRQLERLGKCTTIPVYTDGRMRHAFTAENGGESVRVRGRPEGKWHLRPTVTSQPAIPVNRPAIPVNRPTFLGNNGGFAQPGWLDNVHVSPSHVNSSTHDDDSLSNQLSSLTIRRPERRPDFLCNVASNGPVPVPGEGGVTYLDPKEMRYTKQQIPATFEDGRALDELRRSVTAGFVSTRSLSPLAVHRVFGVNFVMDGNRRLKALADAQESGDFDLKVKVKIEEVDEDDFLDTMREKQPSLQVFDVLQMGKTITVCY